MKKLLLSIAVCVSLFGCLGSEEDVFFEGKSEPCTYNGGTYACGVVFYSEAEVTCNCGSCPSDQECVIYPNSSSCVLVPR